MKIGQKRIPASGLKFTIEEAGKELARATVFIMTNDLHERPFALLEDVFVEPDHRGRGLGNELLRRILARVRELDCYKIIASSRFERGSVHEWYKRLSFVCHGYEFRLDLN